MFRYSQHRELMPSANQFNRSLIVFGGLLLLSCLSTRSGAEPIDADYLLVDGTIMDGSGEASHVGSVAIRGDRIVAVGEFEVGTVGKTISCEGMIIAPGFIDLHNHSDSSIEIKDERTGEEKNSRPIFADATQHAECYLTQGCTTLVTGNCGGGALPVGEFYDSLSEVAPGINVAHLLPQGALREQVIGLTRRAPTDEELQEMKKLASQAMQEGAWGMTTGLQYVPSSFADSDELAAIASVVGQHGGFYASHIRDEGDLLLESIEEALEIGRSGNLPVHISHLKSSKRPNWGKVHAAAALVERARSAGMHVTADQYPYEASSTSITAMLLPDVEREGGTEALLQRLNDTEQLPRLQKLIEESIAARGAIMIARCPKHPTWVGKMIREVAKEENREPVDVALDILRSGEEQGVSFSMSPEDVRYVMTLPWVATASDGGVKVDDGTRPHPRSFGTFPRKIGLFAIEEKVISPETAIRSASGLPADILNLPERGYLKPNYFADVVVFDPQTFRDHATYQAPFEMSSGVRWLFVNGKTAINEGSLGDTNAGRPLRKKAPAEAQ
ncbi:N-acyl-D-amino-acid deacylase family protein [Bythopirellula polymerisocia]|uniref:D-aminoacylase n=1 Tax=Bythopirellula polymerisocia TaxID=2528003 RepID=A0A5C6CF24_9BACT|nr:amidohydrolase family protein [Bythopirellula polymerisocia]TWU22605.1 D-aminoacylase [Bythopirellula polymerisocia]